MINDFINHKQFREKEKYYVDTTSSNWNAFRFWSNYVRYEQI